MKNIHLIAFAFCIILLSCNPTDPVFIGGKGGSAVLLITPQHHGKNIDSCTIYIKYNATNTPTDPYDDSSKCVDYGAGPVVKFSGLKKGDYYIYGFGFDTSIHQNVKGGRPYTVTDENTQIVLLPVSEE